ncbi:MAG: D,D-dipeptide ABC transporter permease, partial [Tateyamaria sp.]|nr:D,D-dipeptide ABC transporter permease [Tateyamaria sp.]
MTKTPVETLRWRAWLLTDTPASRHHAKLSAFYKGWLSFRGNTMAMVGLWILICLILAALFAPLLSPHDPFAQNLGNRLQPLGSHNHVLGTDSLGRDILSRLIYGSRIT